MRTSDGEDEEGSSLEAKGPKRRGEPRGAEVRPEDDVEGEDSDAETYQFRQRRRRAEEASREQTGDHESADGSR